MNKPYSIVAFINVFRKLLCLAILFLSFSASAQWVETTYNMQMEDGTKSLKKDYKLLAEVDSTLNKYWNNSGDAPELKEDKIEKELNGTKESHEVVIALIATPPPDDGGGGGTGGTCSVSLPTASDKSRCGPGSVTLSGTPGSGGTICKWYNTSTSTTAFASGATTTVNVTATRNYYVTSYNGTTGCESAKKTITVTVDQAPVNGNISASFTTICLGQSVTISSSGGTGDPHYWCSSDGGASANVFINNYVGLNSFSHTPASVGTYRYYLMNLTGASCNSTCYNNNAIDGGLCPQEMVYVTVNVVAPPSVTITSTPPILQGETKLTASLSGNYTYKWYKNGIQITGATAISHSTSNSGNYFVRVASPGCESTSPTVNITGVDQNFVITNVVATSGITDPTQVSSLTVDNRYQTIVYMDDLGKTTQQIVTQGSPGKQDITTFAVYDDVGRNEFGYLPYVSGNTGAIKTNVITSQQTFYSNLKSDTRAYGEQKFENSPMSRVTEASAPGVNWSGKTQTMSFGNALGGVIKMWSFNATTKTATSTSTYAAGALARNVQKNEQDFEIITYTNKAGKKICVQEGKASDGYNTTYYIYDNFGLLRFIVPPEPESLLNTVNHTITYNDTFCQRWLFAYDYDNQFRQTEALVPGGGITYNVYDPLGRVILTQDANDRAVNRWMFVKYDVLGRSIMSGVYTHSASVTQAQMQDLVDQYYADGSKKYYESLSSTNYAALHGYTNQAFPVIAAPNTINSQPYIISYYDNYDFDHNAVEGETSKGEPLFINFGGSYSAPTAGVKGKLTGTRTVVLGTFTYLTNATYYDSYGRVIQSQGENYSTGARNIDVVSTEYDFSGKVIRSERRHRTLVSDNTYAMAIKSRYVYDHAGRVLEKYLQINNEPEERITKNTYNEIDEVVRQELSYPTLQTIDYEYNIRGWLTSVNKTAQPGDPVDYFSQEINYTTAISTSDSRYDGFALSNKWKHDISDKERLYEYKYDTQNRLKDSEYKLNKNNGGWVTDTGLYSEKNIDYDKNGNIKVLQRYRGSTVANQIDNLDYNYGATGGNQLMSVTDQAPAANKDEGFKDGNTTGNDYAYDANGNLTSDLNKAISLITYNTLDLTDRITFSNGSYIQFTYDGSGTKLSNLYYDNTDPSNPKQFSTEYQGGIVYADGELRIIFHDGGRIVPSSNANQIASLATSDANTLEGFTTQGSVSLARAFLQNETYVRITSAQTGGSSGVGMIGGMINVRPGERYSFKILGYRETSDNAYLYVGHAGGDIVINTQLLPLGLANETWTTATFTVPAGVTQINVGVLFSNPVVGAVCYINQAKLYKLDYEYQYFLNDHLGSPRVVLQTNPSTRIYTATMESENLATESADFNSEKGQFMTLDEGYEVPMSGLANATPGGNKALKMNATYHIGPSKTFKVLPGDVIDASVWAYYNTGTYSKTPLGDMAGYVLQVLTGSPAAFLSGVENAYTAASNGTNPNIVLSANQGSGKPSAFLNYILFDDAYRPIKGESVPVGGADVLHQLTMPTVSVKEAGYLFVYLSYDNDTGADVYFDDLKITYKESPVVQLNSYYPYGMTAYTFYRDGEYQNKFLYQGKEFNETTGLHDFHARQYDAALARWFAVDPAGQFMTPYLAMGNLPNIAVDPDGRYVLLDDAIAAIVGGVINLGVNAWQGNLSGHGLWGGIGRGFAAFGAGAVGGVGALYPEFGGWLWGGATVGATNAWLSGATAPTDIAVGAATGAVTSVVGGSIGTALAPTLTSVTNGIASPVLRGMIGGALGGAFTGGLFGGFGAMASGQDFWSGAGSGAIFGLGTGIVSGGLTAGATAQSRGFNPWNGRQITPPKPETPILKVPEIETPKIETPKISLGRFERSQFRSDINDADFNMALNEWNNIRQQYGQAPTNMTTFKADGFNATLGDGSRVSAQFYQGGGTNPSGYNIKITILPPLNSTDKLQPPIYLRYHN